ncbi:MAG: signal recognition particle protein [Candidatus Goldbacteria bacterium]|nr:signal recognition particle protein [Candidatus Goldiibacteriota bacterium]
MFETITSKLSGILKKITRIGIITEKNVEDAIKEIRLSLLEADVNYKVVKQFTEKVKEKAIGSNVIKSITANQQFIKIIHDELVTFLGGSDSGLTISKKPATIMLVGLQGCGKTTTAAKLAGYLKSERNLKKILLVGLDVYRPAAKDQLRKLSTQINVDFYSEEQNDAVKIAKNALAKSENEFYDALIFDTAGRLHIDDKMMDELKKIKSLTVYNEILLVVDSMLGQISVDVAKSFNDVLGITGIILTKADGDARGGAALSMKFITNVPIKFIGTGEKLDRFEEFHPDRMASRILGMGDVVSLVEKAEKTVTMEQAKKTEEKLRKATFNFEDFLEQINTIKNMGPMNELVRMMPGAAGLSDLNFDEKELKRTEAVILSMTPKERLHPEIIDESRRRRIAKGAGTTPEKVNRLLKQFNQMKKMMKKMSNKKFSSRPQFPFPGF